MWKKIFQCFIILLSLMCASYGSKILGIFHMSSYSHFVLGNTLLKAMAAKGHEVTIISAFEEKLPIANYRTICIPKILEAVATFQFMDMKNYSLKENINFLHDFTYALTELTLNNTDVQNLLKSNETFDIVIIEQFMNEAFRGFQYHYQVPCIIFSTVKSNGWTNNIMGNPQNPSYVPDIFTAYVSPMSFFQRLHNSILYLIHYFTQSYVTIPKQNKLMHKYFPQAPHLNELLFNTSLILLNSHPSINKPIALLPNMIEVAGMHIKAGKLPEDIKIFLDNAPEGVVYFSLGSNLKSKDINIVKLNAIMKVFSKLKMKILWKFENESFLPATSNIKISKWLPQQDILAHPNVNLFITHGGVLSTIEAVHYGKPILGIPFYGDQKLNVEEAKYSGYGLILDYDDLTEETFSKVLNELLNNSKYSKTAKILSETFRDQPQSPIERAVYWVEYVVRHKGAYHLRSNSLYLNWYQYLLLDVICFVQAFVLLLIGVFYISFKCLLAHLRKKRLNLSKKYN